MRTSALVYLSVTIALPFWMVIGCRTTGGNRSVGSDVVRAAPSIQLADPLPQTIRECPPQSMAFPEVSDPQLCFATRYAGQRLATPDRPVAFGSNAVVARHNLSVLVCESEKLPSKVTGVSCLPDPSEGNCPVIPPILNDSSTPTQCNVRFYAGKLMPKGEQLYSWGLGKHQAVYRLKMLACRKHYNPTKLGEIKCSPSESAKECPPRTENCSNASAETVCRFETDNENAPVQEFSECQARWRLSLRACEKGIKPSSLGSIICESVKRNGS